LLKWLKIAKTSTNLLLFLVNDTLDFYQIKSGKFIQRVTSFSITEEIENCFDLIAIQMEQKGLQKIIEIDEDLMHT
jgi:signal transduction histidine kinase